MVLGLIWWSWEPFPTWMFLCDFWVCLLSKQIAFSGISPPAPFTVFICIGKCLQKQNFNKESVFTKSTGIMQLSKNWILSMARSGHVLVLWMVLYVLVRDEMTGWRVVTWLLLSHSFIFFVCLFVCFPQTACKQLLFSFFNWFMFMTEDWDHQLLENFICFL